MMGTAISNTMIFAVNVVASGTKSFGGQRTLPMLRLTGSMEVRLRTTFDPEAAHGTKPSSNSMAERNQE